ncbi:MAG TPA: glutamate--tRNA ligase [Candidatus Polarisedimenticolia bacterium]|nr:glutamate--tRNA ligase [Candidatus Polarisedimenticolia bacterium]
MSAPRVRFAPSPTGYLHVGGARTALFNWLYARREKGVFILRIEDTDQARSSKEMVEAILEGLRWLGIGHDEGPYFQTALRGEHERAALRLLEAGRAYRCFCTAEALDARRQAAEANGRAWKYDRACLALPPGDADRRAAAGEPWVMRFRVPEGVTEYDDLVHGPTRFQNSDIEDLVLLRSDGSPTYNLSCVVDDRSMRITHVIRGDDHISNTPKQILLHAALEAEPPRFGHLPLILGEDKKRLSKRHGAVSVIEYRKNGYLPEALFNFLALLGWSPGGDREIMTVAEMVEAFSFQGVGSRSAVFDHDKLLWMNGEYLKRRQAADLAGLVRPWLESEGLWSADLEDARKAWFLALLDLLKERCRLLPDLAGAARPFLTERFDYDPAGVEKHFTAGAAGRLIALRDALAALPSLDEGSSEAVLRDLAGRLDVKAAALIHPARLALTGRTVGPSLFAVMAAMGRDGVLRRLERAARVIEAPAGPRDAAQERG